MQDFIDSIGTGTNTILFILIIIGCALLTQAFLRFVLQRSTAFLTRKELFNNTRERQKRIKTINSIIGAVAGITVWSIAGLMILQKLGVPIAPIIASAGIVGAAIAFGTQSLIKDFVSGLFIIAENQYHIDDYVDIGSISGKVEAVSVRTTAVRGEDGSIYYIPNGSISMTSNKSVGPIKEILKLELAADTNLTTFAKKISEISEKLTTDEATSDLFVEGPSVGSITAVTKKSISLQIEFKVTASKRKRAASAVWRAIAAANKKESVHLA